MSDSLWLHGLQHARPPCPSPTPGACSNSCLSRRWCHPTTSSSVFPFSSCLQSFPVSGSFQMSQLFASGGQNIGASASASVLPRNIQGWLPLGTGWISFQSKGLSRVFSNTTIQKHQFFRTLPSLLSNSHICSWLLERPWLWLCRPLLAKWCLCVLICFPCWSWLSFQLQSPSTLILELKKRESHCFYLFPFYLPWNDGTGCPDLSFLILSFKPACSLSSFTLTKKLFSSSSLSAIRVSSAYLSLLLFLPAVLIPACNLIPAWHFAWCTLHWS